MELPDFGDIAGLTRLYEQAVQRIRARHYEPEEEAARLAVLEAFYLAALRPYRPC